MDRFCIITNSDKDKELKLTGEIVSYLEAHGRQCLVQQAQRKEEGPFHYTDPGLIPEGTECILVLGGDGTLLQAARDVVHREIPLLGMNLGTLGFLAEVDRNSIYTSLDQIMADDFEIEERMMLTGSVLRGNQILGEDVALNDIVISRDGPLRVVRFKNYVNNEYLNSYNADGIIISTPTGSTGYSLSCGGPVVSPNAAMTLMTPIAPHTMNTRSIIFPAEDVITVEIGEGRRQELEKGLASFDGDTVIPMVTGDRIVIRKATCSCNEDPTPKWFWRGDYEEGVEDFGYRELYVRWFEQGVFLPMFRSHGTDTPREVWNFGSPGEPFYDALVKNIELRYKLMPYIYSNAAKVWTDDYTMMRSLLFDFAEDKHAATLGEEYMFGDSLLVCPVTEPMYYERESRAIDREKVWNCYLPKGTKWYDFYTLKEYEGGAEVKADASLDHIPVFVKAGAIIPMEQRLRYADEAVDTPFEIHIYPGADGSFVLYEDDGDGYAYEQGRYNQILLTWKDNERCLTVGAAEYTFAQGLKGRECRVILEGTKLEKRFVYNGEAEIRF